MLTRKEFEQLFEQYINDVVSFLYTYSSDKAEVKDWTQEVFIKLWEKRESINFEHPSFKGYLLKTARNHALKQLKRERKYEHWLEKKLEELTSVTPSIAGQRSKNTGLQKAHQVACSKIPKRAREAYLLSREDGLIYSEIAEVMGISVKTVETHISKALEILRDELREFV